MISAVSVAVLGALAGPVAVSIPGADGSLECPNRAAEAGPSGACRSEAPGRSKRDLTAACHAAFGLD